MAAICANYIQFSKLEKGDQLSIKDFHRIFTGGSSVTIEDDSIRGAKTVNYFDVKVGDKVNNGTRFIEIVEEE